MSFSVFYLECLLREVLLYMNTLTRDVFLTIDTCRPRGYDLVETLILDHQLYCTLSYTILYQFCSSYS